MRVTQARRAGRARPAWRSERRPWGRGRRPGRARLDRWPSRPSSGTRSACRRPFSTSTSPRSITPTATSSPSELKAGRFSRWCPGLYCGLPLYSESQAGYLHPLKYLLYPWLATWQAFNLDTVLSVWLTGLGTYGWLRRHVGPAGALTGAARLRTERVRLGAPDPHEHDQRPDERPVRRLGAGMGLGRRRGSRGGPGRARAGLPGLRRTPPGHDPDRRARSASTRLYRAATERRRRGPTRGTRDGGRAGRPGRRALGRAVGPVEGTCSTARPGPGG